MNVEEEILRARILGMISGSAGVGSSVRSRRLARRRRRIMLNATAREIIASAPTTLVIAATNVATLRFLELSAFVLWDMRSVA